MFSCRKMGGSLPINFRSGYNLRALVLIIQELNHRHNFYDWCKKIDSSVITNTHFTDNLKNEKMFWGGQRAFKGRRPHTEADGSLIQIYFTHLSICLLEEWW